MYVYMRVLKDHDECATGNHTCNHICNNLPGTHECLCYTGYELSDDSYTCVGKKTKYQI